MHGAKHLIFLCKFFHSALFLSPPCLLFFVVVKPLSELCVNASLSVPFHTPSPSRRQVDSIHQELVCRVSDDARGFRIKMNAGIAGHVSTTGESLNIGDAYLDPRFNQVRV
jgi:hypothetical protein